MKRGSFVRSASFPKRGYRLARVVLAAALLVTVLTIGVFAHASVAHADVVGLRIYNDNSKLCFEDYGGSMAQGLPQDGGAYIDQWACSQDWPYNQQWQFTKINAGVPGYDTYEIINVNSGKCLEVYNGSSAVGLPSNGGATIDQWTCNGTLNQLWQFSNFGAPTTEIINANSQKCLEVYGYSTTQGLLPSGDSPIDQWTCHGGSNQLWWVA